MIFTLNEIKNITKEKVSSLKENQVAEDKHLEYKLRLPSEKYEDKKEFLADISSFANADGGVIFYGINAKDGIPDDITGLDIDNTDKEILRLENLLRTSIEPRIIGIFFHPFKLSNGRYLIIVYIPKSFNPPHVVNFQGHWRFYSRNSAGKYPLDVSELRSIISLSDTVYEKIRNFRIERISRIKNHDLHFTFSSGPKFVYHLIPLNSFSLNTSIDLKILEYSSVSKKLFSYFEMIYNYEGILIYNSIDKHKISWYSQIFRNGIIEVCGLLTNEPSKKEIDPNIFETEIISVLPNWFKVTELYDLSFPFLFFYSLIDIKDYQLQLGSHEMGRRMRKSTF